MIRKTAMLRRKLFATSKSICPYCYDDIFPMQVLDKEGGHLHCGMENNGDVLVGVLKNMERKKSHPEPMAGTIKAKIEV